jgi:hypothetical protein
VIEIFPDGGSPKDRSGRWRWTVWPVACFAASTFVWWAGAVWALLPYGSVFFYRASFFAMIAFFLALAGLPVSLLAALFRRIRRGALRFSAVCLAFLLGFWVAANISGWQRQKRMATVPTTAAPLVAAIEAFEREQHRLPERLDDLVPRYVVAIPSTGFGGHQEWHYAAPPRTTGHPDDEIYGTNRWVLALYVGARPFPSYRMLYLPDQQYPSTAGRVGTWAYTHY